VTASTFWQIKYEHSSTEENRRENEVNKGVCAVELNS